MSITLRPVKFDLTATECREFGGEFKGGTCVFPSEADEIRGKISWLLFAERPDRTEPEILTVVVPKEKAHHFEFLKAYTKWPSKGKWKELFERNVVFEILYHDRKDEAVGRELMAQLDKYREKVLKEEALYARTTPVEETTL